MLIMVLAVTALAVVNMLYKAAGPAILGDRPFPPAARAVADALPVALLAAMLAVDLLGNRWRDLDCSLLPGLAAALALRSRGRSHLTCIVVGVVCTATIRALLTSL
jgi:branched-subunit amino acid transport protein